MNILTVNLLFSTLVFWIAARLYILPRLDDLKPNVILLPILLLHSLRHLGLMFDTPWATLHWRAEGMLEFYALLFIPGMKPLPLPWG